MPWLTTNVAPWHTQVRISAPPLPQINACHGAFAKSKFAMTLKQNRRDPLDEVKVEVGVSLGVVVEVDVEFEVDVEDGVGCGRSCGQC